MSEETKTKIQAYSSIAANVLAGGLLAFILFSASWARGMEMKVERLDANQVTIIRALTTLTESTTELAVEMGKLQGYNEGQKGAGK